MTIAEQLIQEGRQEGLLDGERILLKRLLTRKFGTLPESVSSKLKSATAEQLEQWGESVLEANDLESLFGSKI